MVDSTWGGTVSACAEAGLCRCQIRPLPRPRTPAQKAVIPTHPSTAPVSGSPWTSQTISTPNKSNAARPAPKKGSAHSASAKFHSSQAKKRHRRTIPFPALWKNPPKAVPARCFLLDKGRDSSVICTIHSSLSCCMTFGLRKRMRNRAARRWGKAAIARPALEKKTASPCPSLRKKFPV